MYTYEVAFILSTDRECSSTNVNTLPDGYTSYRNTTETHIEIIELESNTCYIFGVRVYSTVPGDWNILVERTEGIKYKIIIHNKIVIICLHSDYICMRRYNIFMAHRAIPLSTGFNV